MYKVKWLDESIQKTMSNHKDHEIAHLLLQQDGRVMWFSHAGLEDVTKEVEITIE